MPFDTKLLGFWRFTHFVVNFFHKNVRTFYAFFWAWKQNPQSFSLFRHMMPKGTKCTLWWQPPSWMVILVEKMTIADSVEGLQLGFIQMEMNPQRQNLNVRKFSNFKSKILLLSSGQHWSNVSVFVCPQYNTSLPNTRWQYTNNQWNSKQQYQYQITINR